jgi:hypothetical protein
MIFTSRVQSDVEERSWLQSQTGRHSRETVLYRHMTNAAGVAVVAYK